MSKARIVISPDGLQVGVYVLDGTFEEARAKLKTFFEQLGAEVKIEELGEIERHRHDDERLQVREGVHE